MGSNKHSLLCFTTGGLTGRLETVLSEKIKRLPLTGFEPTTLRLPAQHVIQLSHSQTLTLRSSVTG